MQQAGPRAGLEVARVRRWLDEPLSAAGCFAAWALASVVFVGAVALIGGPSMADLGESSYATWAVAHVNLACAYPPVSGLNQVLPPAFRAGVSTPPLWPLLSGGLSSVTGIGHAMPFPAAPALGVHCGSGTAAMYVWAVTSGAVRATTDLAYASWFVLLAGVVALVRAAGRGRSRGEAVAVLAVAAVPVVWMPLLEYFHPQDVVALGLVLGAAACALRARWGWTGVLLGLAVATQQFALLPLMAVVVVAPEGSRRRIGAGAGALWGAVTLPFLVASHGQALGPVLVGTGAAGTFGGTLLWETGLRGGALTLCARGLPLVGAGVVALWARRRLGPGALAPAPFVSLVAVCLALRVVFEEGLFGYKLMALVVMVVVVAVVSGRITPDDLSWLALATLAYTWLPARLTAGGLSYGDRVVAVVETGAIVVFAGAQAWEFGLHRVVTRRALAGFALLPILVVHWLPTAGSLPAPLPKWFWQVTLVSTGMVLVSRPLVAAARATRSPLVTSAGARVLVPAVAPAPADVPGIVPADARRRAWLAGQGAGVRVALE